MLQRSPPPQGSGRLRQGAGILRGIGDGLNPFTTSQMPIDRSQRTAATVARPDQLDVFVLPEQRTSAQQSRPAPGGRPAYRVRHGRGNVHIGVCPGSIWTSTALCDVNVHTGPAKATIWTLPRRAAAVPFRHATSPAGSEVNAVEVAPAGGLRPCAPHPRADPTVRPSMLSLRRLARARLPDLDGDSSAQARASDTRATRSVRPG